MTRITVDEECKTAFQTGFKSDSAGRTAGPKLAYIIFSLSPDYERIILLKKVARDQNPTYDDFINEFPPKEPRWAVYFFEFEKEDGAGKRQKICFVSW